jgi:hypothetical protein
MRFFMTEPRAFQVELQKHGLSIADNPCSLDDSRETPSEVAAHALLKQASAQ